MFGATTSSRFVIVMVHSKIISANPPQHHLHHHSVYVLVNYWLVVPATPLIIISSLLTTKDAVIMEHKSKFQMKAPREPSPSSLSTSPLLQLTPTVCGTSMSTGNHIIVHASHITTMTRCQHRKRKNATHLDSSQFSRSTIMCPLLWFLLVVLASPCASESLRSNLISENHALGDTTSSPFRIVSLLFNFPAMCDFFLYFIHFLYFIGR